MTSRRRITAGLAALAIALVLPATSQASPRHSAAAAAVHESGSPEKATPKADTGITGTFENRVRYAPTWVFQCPMGLCNRAENVYPEDVLTDYCYVVGSPVEGNPYWDLVYVRTHTKKYAGFVPEAYLQDRSQTTPC